MEGVPPEVIVAQKAGGSLGIGSSWGAEDLAIRELFARSSGIVASLPPATIATSDVHDDHPHHAKTNLPLGHSHAWCARKGGANEVTIDLLEPRLVTGIALQGRAESDQFATRVELHTSINGTAWTREGVYIGCFDNITVVKRALPAARLVTFVKLKILEFHDHPSLRMDVLVV